MRDSVITLLVVAAAGALASCSASDSLTTGSLFGNKQDAQAQAAAAAAKPVTPADRLVEVASNSARAQRCSFYFDAAQLKASWLASEQAAGAPPEQIDKMSKEYDVLRAKVLAAIVEDDKYCTEGRNREVKAKLNRQLAGDFSPPASKQTASASLFDLNQRNPDREVFMPSEVFNPMRKSTTRPAD